MSWQPGDDLFVRFDDKTGAERTASELEAMVEAMKEIANDHDFDLSCYGSWETAGKIIDGERALGQERSEPPK